MGENATVTILGSLSLIAALWVVSWMIALLEQRRNLKKYNTLITLTRATRGRFNLADFKHNLTYGGQIPLSDREAVAIAEAIPLSDAPWDSEDELTTDGITNAEIRKKIRLQSFAEVRNRLQRNKIKTAIEDKGAIETVLERINQGHLLRRQETE